MCDAICLLVLYNYYFVKLADFVRATLSPPLGNCWSTGQMPFLSPNQQHESIEGLYARNMSSSRKVGNKIVDNN